MIYIFILFSRINDRWFTWRFINYPIPLIIIVLL